MAFVPTNSTLPYVFACYKSLNGHAPEYLSQLFTKISEMHSRNLRSVDKDELKVPFARTNYFAKSFSVEGVVVWWC